MISNLENICDIFKLRETLVRFILLNIVRNDYMADVNRIRYSKKI